MAEALLTLEEIEVRYGGPTPVLRIPFLEVLPGEVLAIIGPNGAGKSTLLRVMGLLEQAEKGRIYFQAQEVFRKNALAMRRRMATVFREPLLLHMTVYENAALGLTLRGLKRQSIEAKVKPWLERLGIDRLAKRPARSLSDGEAQRTSLARALTLDPELLLLDEPFSALDPPTREKLLLDLQTILRETGITTVFVTHDRNEAFMLGHRVAVLSGGEMLQLGPAAELLSRPSSEIVAQFVGVETQVPGIVEAAASGRAMVRFDGGRAEVIGDYSAGERVLICLRPEDISLSSPPEEHFQSNGQNHLTAKVAKITPWGSHYRIALECGASSFVALVARPSFLDLQLREGDCLIASFKVAATHIIRRG